MSGRDFIDTDILGITADSRQVEPGFLFAALSGAQVDGAWDAIGLFNGDDLLVSTANITCEAGLPLTGAALEALWDVATAEE